MEKKIRISTKKYEGMKDTIEMLQDVDMISQVLESEKNISSGNIKEFEY